MSNELQVPKPVFSGKPSVSYERIKQTETYTTGLSSDYKGFESLLDDIKETRKTVNSKGAKRVRHIEIEGDLTFIITYDIGEESDEDYKKRISNEEQALFLWEAYFEGKREEKHLRAIEVECKRRLENCSHTLKLAETYKNNIELLENLLNKGE